MRGCLTRILACVVAAVADAVLRLRDAVALDRELAVLDLGEPRPRPRRTCGPRRRRWLRSSANGTVAVAPAGSGSTIPWPRNAPPSKTAIGPRSSTPLVRVGEARHAERVARRVGDAAVGREEKQRLAGDAPRQEHHHRRAPVGDRDGQRQVVARRAALDRDRRERAKVARGRDERPGRRRSGRLHLGRGHGRPGRANRRGGSHRSAGAPLALLVGGPSRHRRRPVPPRPPLRPAPAGAPGRELAGSCASDVSRVRHRRDHLALVGHGRPRRDDGRPQLRLERERSARDERQLHVLPVLARQVLDDAPGLQVGVSLGVDDEPVRRPPHGRLGHVPDLQIVRLPVEREDDRLEPLLPRASALRSAGDRRPQRPCRRPRPARRPGPRRSRRRGGETPRHARSCRRAP